MSYKKTWEEASKAKLPLVGLFASDALNTTAPNIPSLAEMTELALDLLSEDENGFFLMVEGSQIDTKAHDNAFEKQMYEMYQFDCAITVVMEFMAKHPDTVLIVTADHETGGLYFPREDHKEDGAYVYLSDDHTSINVPVYAMGYGTEALGGIIENTDIAGFVAGLLGETDLAQQSEVIKLYDWTESEQADPYMDQEHPSVEILNPTLDTKLKGIKNARAIHIVMENKESYQQTTPALKLHSTDGNSYDVVSQYAYISPGERLILTYILPVELWQDYALSKVNSILTTVTPVEDNAWKTTFGYEEETISLEKLEISITDRVLEN
jgi:hypothetical protein